MWSSLLHRFHFSSKPALRRLASLSVAGRLLHTSAGLNMASPSKKLTPAKRIDGLDKNVWVEFSGIVAREKPVNLGQGMPDYPPPEFVLDALKGTTKNPLLHQYTRGQGHPRLVNALAKLYSPLHGREIDPMNEVIVSCGAYSILSHAIQGFIQEGDEVIIIEPFFDCYSPMVKMAGGKMVFVPLRSQGKHPNTCADLTLDPTELEAAFNEKTKMIIVCTPNNPTGKVFTRSELELVADLCKRYDVMCISDEVYEWLVYSGSKHLKIATLPGMWERTVTVGSAGKTFHATGWKTGWGIGPSYFIKPMHTCLTNISYTNNTPIQEAIAVGLETELQRMGHPDSYLVQTVDTLQRKRDEIVAVLREVGMEPIVPEGGYFILADVSSIGKTFDSNEEPYDFLFTKWMIAEKGLSAIPPSAFYSPEHGDLAGKYIRFHFAKADSTLQKAYDILRQWSKDRQDGKS